MQSDNELPLESVVTETKRLRPSIETGSGFVELTRIS